MRRTMVIPVIVLLLGIAAIGTTTLLDRHAAASRSSGLRLATLKSALVSLQGAPFAANASTGGNAVTAARAMRDDKRQIAITLDALEGNSPPDSLE